MKPAKFTVVRSGWLRGEGGSVSTLRRSADGKQCCLGFLGDACGVEYGEATYPSYHHTGWPDELFSPHERIEGAKTPSMTCNALMEVNDNPVTNDEQRENRLTKLFASIGIAVEFVDHAPTSPTSQAQ